MKPQLILILSLPFLIQIASGQSRSGCFRGAATLSGDAALEDDMIEFSTELYGNRPVSEVACGPTGATEIGHCAF